jgi:DNA modification methylase
LFIQKGIYSVSFYQKSSIPEHLQGFFEPVEIGLEPTPEEYVAEMVKVFREVKRVLRDDGTLWLNLGDSYAADRGYQVTQTKGGPKHGVAQGVGGRPQKASDYNLKPKDLIGIPWMVAFALRSDGWYLRQDIIWAKPNPMPESVTDRCTKSHEYIFLLSKSPKYFYDHVAIKEKAVGGNTGAAGKFKRVGSKREQTIPNQGYGTHRPDRDDVIYNGPTRNRRSVWNVATKPYKGAHFATFPKKLIEPCILAGCPEKVCSSCGSPWERIIEKPKMPSVDESNVNRYGNGSAGVHRKVGQAYQDWRDANPDKTVGERPTCNCNAIPKPGTVLDPFSGSGTTLEVAMEHSRSGVGLELNPDYIKLSLQRLERFNPIGLFKEPSL